MVSTELVDFMRKEFGNKCLKLLNDMHSKLNIDDIEYADTDLKKQFILELQPHLKNRSLARSEFVITELMSILGIVVDSIAYTDTTLSYSRADLIKNYVSFEAVNQLKVAKAEANAMMRIYFMNTDVALKKGISEAKIRGATKKSLKGLEKGLVDIADKIDNEFNLKTSVSIMQMKLREALEKGEPINKELIERQISMAYTVSSYRKRVKGLYDEYEKLFMKSLEKKLSHDKIKRDTKVLEHTTKLLIADVFERIDLTFDSFQKQILDN